MQADKHATSDIFFFLREQMKENTLPPLLYLMFAFSMICSRSASVTLALAGGVP